MFVLCVLSNKDKRKNAMNKENHDKETNTDEIQSTKSWRIEGSTVSLRKPYLLTPWSRVLPEKLKRPELLKKFPAFYGTRRFITAFSRARHLSLS
jgi:hypothetical protein